MLKASNKCVCFSHEQNHYGIIDYGKASFYALESVSIKLHESENAIWNYSHRSTKTQGYFLNLSQILQQDVAQLDFDDQIIFFKNIKQFGILTKFQKGQLPPSQDIDQIKQNPQTEQKSFLNNEYAKFIEVLTNFEQSLYLIDPLKAYDYFSKKYDW